MADSAVATTARNTATWPSNAARPTSVRRTPYPTSPVGDSSLDGDAAGGLEGAELFGQRGSTTGGGGSRTEAKSIQSAEASNATMDRRVLGWMSSSNRGSVIRRQPVRCGGARLPSGWALVGVGAAVHQRPAVAAQPAGGRAAVGTARSGRAGGARELAGSGRGRPGRTSVSSTVIAGMASTPLGIAGPRCAAWKRGSGSGCHGGRDSPGRRAGRGRYCRRAGRRSRRRRARSRGSHPPLLPRPPLQPRHRRAHRVFDRVLANLDRTSNADNDTEEAPRSQTTDSTRSDADRAEGPSGGRSASSSTSTPSQPDAGHRRARRGGA